LSNLVSAAGAGTKTAAHPVAAQARRRLDVSVETDKHQQRRGGAGLLHPPDGAQAGRGQDRDAGCDGRLRPCSVGRSSSERRGDFVLARPQRRGTQQTVVAARLDDQVRQSSSRASDTALLLPPRRGDAALPNRASRATIAFLPNAIAGSAAKDVIELATNHRFAPTRC
jgi:hypothetical protein